MTLSIAKIIAPGRQASDDDVLSYLRAEYRAKPSETLRRQRARERHLLYHDGGDELIVDQIKAAFSNDVVINARLPFVRPAKFNNVTKRVVNELSTIYARPATRTVKGRGEEYKAVQRDVMQDQLMQRVNRYLNLHRQVWVGFRTRDGKPVLDIVTPDNFYAVADPTDPTKLIAIIIDTSQPTWNPPPGQPAFTVWTESEVFKLDADWRWALDPSGNKLPIKLHGFGRMPGVLASIEPLTDRLLDDSEGDDLTAAHIAVWFENVMLLKESKSLNRQLAFQGDLTTTAKGQASDSDIDLTLGDGVGVQTVDRGVDLAPYRETADYAIERVAANYGIPPSVLRHEGATSGFEIELRRIGIRERRRQQEPTFRSLEREIAEVQSMVLAAEGNAEYRFKTDGWGIDFSPNQTPMEPDKELDLFKQERQLGLTNTLAFMIEKDPDLDEVSALKQLQDNIAVEIARVQEMQALARLNASMGTEPGDNTPEENGQEALKRRGAESADNATAA